MKHESRLRAGIEAALYMANDPISIEDLAKLLKGKPEDIKAILEQMKLDLEDPSRGIRLMETSVGYQIRVKPEFSQQVRGLTPYQDLSRGLLRVLALVAYKQPITQSEVVKVIGNRAYEYVKVLADKGLINTVKHGRTKALIATKEFANYFGLESTEDIKKFFEQMTQGKGEENEA